MTTTKTDAQTVLAEWKPIPDVLRQYAKDMDTNTRLIDGDIAPYLRKVADYLERTAAQRLVDGMDSDRERQGGFIIGDVVEYIGIYKDEDGWRGCTFIVCGIEQKKHDIEYTLREHGRWSGLTDGLLQSDLRLAPNPPTTSEEA